MCQTPRGLMTPIDLSARASRPEFDVHLTASVMVAMRDGVRLATDIYRPARDGRPLNERRPVLLHCRPYNKGCHRCGPLARACMRSIVPGHHSKWSGAWMVQSAAASGGRICSIVRVPCPSVWRRRLQLPDRIR